MCSEWRREFALWFPGHQEGMRCRKETALEEQQSLCFKALRSFLVRWTQGIRYLRTHELLVRCGRVTVILPNIWYSPEHQLQHDVFTEEADQSPEESQRHRTQLTDTHARLQRSCGFSPNPACPGVLPGRGC